MKAVVVFSGGIDSTLALVKALIARREIYTITFSYGQRAWKRELEATLDIRNSVGGLLPAHFEYLTEFYMGKGPMLDESLPMPEGRNDLEALDVPFRNPLMLAHAVTYAIQVGAEEVWHGIHAGCFTRDASPEFVSTFSAATWIGSNHKVRIISPLIELTKTQVVKQAHDLSVPLRKTYSCYVGKHEHCGKCANCLSRKQAFQEAGIVDPTVYQEETEFTPGFLCSGCGQWFPQGYSHRICYGLGDKEVGIEEPYAYD